MGDTHMLAVNKAIKHTKADRVYIANNRMTSDAIYDLLNNLNPSIRELNLSENKMDHDNEGIQTVKRNL